MFLRVQIRRSRDSLRFLWRNNMNENPLEYQMTSLIFRRRLILVLRSTSKSSQRLSLNLSTRRRQPSSYAVGRVTKWSLEMKCPTRNDDNVQARGRHTGEKPSAYGGTSIMTPWVSICLRNTPTEVLETSLPPTKRQVTVQSCPCSTRSV
ncbi:hypothetical protein EVAR_38049_1 [Eumeta japonica]|uniref:Uncharacterized protein n=1 Tax=Eumeta variegata TaxID=151549 RepID=A0A4C1WAW8_EUMVA|nr:hypothetical protein EVAR_38049_1 [Eumeta japonica]